MTTDEYLKLSANTDIPDYEVVRQRLAEPGVAELLHAVMGIVTESGELMDALKKFLIYGKPLDEVNLREELGDSEWYTALAIRVLKAKYEEIWERNIAKLQKRYPEKFTEYHALNRDITAERLILSQGAVSDETVQQIGNRIVEERAALMKRLADGE